MGAFLSAVNRHNLIASQLNRILTIAREREVNLRLASGQYGKFENIAVLPAVLLVKRQVKKWRQSAT